MAPTIEELNSALESAQVEVGAVDVKLSEATATFENARDGSMSDLLKAAKSVESAQREVAKADKQLKSTAYAVEHFATVGIYESIKAAVAKASDKWPLSELLTHDVHEVTIRVNIDDDGKAGEIVVNTLGKKTRLASTNGGRRSRISYVKGDESLNSRQLVEAYGVEVIGEERTARVLDDPGRFGLTHAADSIAEKQGYEKTQNGEAK